MDQKTIKRLIAVAASALLVLIIFFACCTVVDSGEVGIKFHKWSASEQDYGGVEGTCKGWVFYNPITTSVFTYPTFTQRKQYETIKVNAKDADEARRLCDKEFIDPEDDGDDMWMLGDTVPEVEDLANLDDCYKHVVTCDGLVERDEIYDLERISDEWRAEHDNKDKED